MDCFVYKGKSAQFGDPIKLYYSSYGAYIYMYNGNILYESIYMLSKKNVHRLTKNTAWYAETD